MVYLIGPDGLINGRFANFHKMVWMTTVHVLRFRIKQQKSSEIITHSQDNFQVHFWPWRNWASSCETGKCPFSYPQFTGYAEYIRFCHKEHLKRQVFCITQLNYSRPPSLIKKKRKLKTDNIRCPMIGPIDVPRSI